MPVSDAGAFFVDTVYPRINCDLSITDRCNTLVNQPQLLHPWLMNKSNHGYWIYLLLLRGTVAHTNI